LHGFTDVIDSPQTSILVAGVEALEGMAHVFGRGGLSKSAGIVATASLATIPSANQSVCHHQRDVIGIRPSATFHGNLMHKKKPKISLIVYTSAAGVFGQYCSVLY